MSTRSSAAIRASRTGGVHPNPATRSNRGVIPPKNLTWGTLSGTSPSVNDPGGGPLGTEYYDTYGLGKSQAFIHWAVRWYQGASFQAFDTTGANKVRAAGAIPYYDWNPYGDGATYGSMPNQSTFKLSNIIAGNFDAALVTWANGLAAWNHPILLRVMHEMNGDWYNWSEVKNGNSGGQFVLAWRHIYNLVAPIVPKAKWFWCPNRDVGIIPISGLYPGDAYVDFTGFDAYFKSSQPDSTTVASLMDSTYNQIVSLAPSKPMIIGEFGVSDRSGTVDNVFLTNWFNALLDNYPRICSINYFNRSESPETTDLTDSGKKAAVVAALTNSRFIGGIYSSATSVPSFV